jgi:uncharacterized membrane protein YfcA
MDKPAKNISRHRTGSLGDYWANHPLLTEFLKDQFPIIAIVFIAGIIASILQHGYLAGGNQPFAVAGVRVPIWHLFWMGFWTGYIMALVGEASGIFSLPYCMSILQFTSVSVSPTGLITTFLNPFGALLGFYRNKQWNLDIALGLCLGAVLGAPIGPFIRVYYLNDPEPFKAVIGVVLFLMSVHLIVQVTPWYLRRTARQREFKEKFDRITRDHTQAGKAPSGLPDDFKITTVEKSITKVTIRYWDETQTFNVPFMVLIGFIVGVVSSALGVGTICHHTLFDRPIFLCRDRTIAQRCYCHPRLELWPFCCLRCNLGRLVGLKNSAIYSGKAFEAHIGSGYGYGGCFVCD